ncbi:LysR family transcriptional regulator [Tropicimonas isoalkanivorans]|uniref:DNA-binding transcriptional regulator, LysR family n=1 Tax=Tropicimonas isoalkanivorans TaxID=441112 RepID=A0A1I1Q3Z6_9RHOB|nr:LysR family transcriptional regulator [Tropicimonas isoalkanivorans]SFD16854.1 DNA-binding transcriptional regulator, LysR family [Tropicimonas isoalkanivorans]
MPLRRDELGDLMAFLAVAEERSFTRAAARLGTSQSALSHVVRRLEERLDIRLLTRTTRNVAPTEAGLRLAETLGPAFEDIESRLMELDELRSQPSGTIRITASRNVARDILMPAVSALMAAYPGLNIEINIDQRLVDIVREGFDAGVRLGEEVEKDMIAIRIGPDMRMIVAGSPAYFARRPAPETPRDLTEHNCINLRLPTLGGLYAWEFEKNGQALNVRVEGQFTSNDPDLMIAAAIAGEGLVFLPEDHLGDLVARGDLVACLTDWCPPFPGYHLYFPSRRQRLPSFRLLADALRYRAG